jgi:hypothetical protein
LPPKTFKYKIKIGGPIRIDLGRLVPDPDPGGQKAPPKMTNISKKLRNFKFWCSGFSILKAEGFSCTLDVNSGDLGISKLQFLIKKYYFFSALNFFQNLVIKPLNLDPDWPKMLDPEPHWNKFGSASLNKTYKYIAE